MQAMEGFNQKVRTMIRRRYGYKDLRNMRLRMFNLPECDVKIIF